MGNEQMLPQNERDLVKKYAPHACCMAILLIAGITAGVIFIIYWIITKLL